MNLRELVEMLPEAMREELIGEWEWQDDIGLWTDGVAQFRSDAEMEAIIGWHLVRWLGERGCSVAPVGKMWDVFDHNGEAVCDAPYPTPIEAAVRAVVIISKGEQQPST